VARSAHPGKICCMGFTVTLLLLLLFIYVPKNLPESASTLPINAPPERFDSTYGRRVGLSIFLALCAFGSTALVVLHYLMNPVKASRIYVSRFKAP